MMEFSSTSSSGSSKRAKTPTLASNISVNVSCLVDGCNSDLSQCREYHRRHKVCELHSKTPKVTIGGREQRFCQQCSRFHSLVEFDEGKRSCRKRLDGHNRRRRKSQVDSLSRTSGMFLSNQQGTTILSFSDPQIHPNPMVSSSWAGVVKPEPDTILFDNHLPVTYIDRPNLFSESSSATAQSNKGGGINQFQFFQSANEANRAGDSRSDRALSLLSSPLPAQTTPEIIQQPNPINSHSLECGGFSQYASFPQEMDNETVLPDSNHDSTLHFQGMFHNGRDGSSPGGGNHQTLSFRWD